MHSNPESYQPGVCNIDDRGASVRRILGWASAVAGVVVLGWMWSSHVLPSYRYLVAVIFSGASIINFRQAKFRFCVVNGSKGWYEILGKKFEIVGEENRRIDRKRANREFIFASLMALVVGTVALIPV